MTYSATLRAFRSRLPAVIIAVVTVSLVAVLALAARPAAADVWSPGQAIGNLSGAEQWCGLPWNTSGCPAPTGQARFNLDVAPWVQIPYPSDSVGGSEIGGYAQFNKDSVGVGIWCLTAVWLGGPIPYIVPIITNIKEVGPGNQPPSAAAGANVSFECPGLYVQQATPPIRIGVPVKWWVHKKGSGSDRGWVYITGSAGPLTGTITQIKVPVTTASYGHSLDICTPNSNHEDCSPLLHGPSTPDLATLSDWYKTQVPPAALNLLLKK